MVIRLCWLATCACRRTPTARARTYSATRCSPPASIRVTCLRIVPLARRMTDAGLARALEFVRAGDVLVVWKLDRLGRSLSHLLAIVTSLKDKRVAFRSLTENLDTTTPSGEFLFQVFGALAQYERALIQERVVAGLAATQNAAGSAAGRRRSLVKLDAIVAALDGGMS